MWRSQYISVSRARCTTSCTYCTPTPVSCHSPATSPMPPVFPLVGARRRRVSVLRDRARVVGAVLRARHRGPPDPLHLRRVRRAVGAAVVGARASGPRRPRAGAERGAVARAHPVVELLQRHGPLQRQHDLAHLGAAPRRVAHGGGGAGDQARRLRRVVVAPQPRVHDLVVVAVCQRPRQRLPRLHGFTPTPTPSSCQRSVRRRRRHTHLSCYSITYVPSRRGRLGHRRSDRRGDGR